MRSRNAVLALTLALACTSASAASLGRFGTYSTVYIEKRWAKMCEGSARYQAMWEAHDLSKPNPCAPPMVKQRSHK
jgi:hypothetical protein